MGLVTKIQNLPESKRKIILWVAIIIIGLGLFTFFIKNAQKKMKGFQVEKLREELRLPSLEEELKKLPEIKIPGFKDYTN